MGKTFHIGLGKSIPVQRLWAVEYTGMSHRDPWYTLHEVLKVGVCDITWGLNGMV